jgi:hypothetical protein
MSVDVEATAGQGGGLSPQDTCMRALPSIAWCSVATSEPDTRLQLQPET